MKLKCLIVDDEPMARRGLEEYVKDVPFLEHGGSCESAAGATEFLRQQPVDVILLDINMPQVTGIEFLKSLENPPLVIFTTAHPDFALEGYSLDVLDYLVKPVIFERFRKAVQKAYEYQVLRASALSSPDFFFIKCDHVFEKVYFNEVLYAEAMQNYCILHTALRKLITYITLGGLEEKLPKSNFLKVHKSFIVNIDKVTALDGSDVFIGKAQIPVSRLLKDEVMTRVMGNNLFKR
ncbi:MAG TPA: LytTR family DNA-binding domain-containing protein [Ohtaekwangia sp.]|nr:LytTR family DNA-binding domain-containing protein [Ohtaekwangia sp.]